MRTLIIAEAGVNHNGNPALARQLIDVAAEAGADVVKFQTFNADLLVTNNARQAAYQERNTGIVESQHLMLKRLELTRETHVELIAYCRGRGIEFFSTGFDTKSLDLLLELGATRIKVPSGELTNLPYLRHVGAARREVILSTGMATLDEVRSALAALEAAGTPRERVIVLHCTTNYPAGMDEVNLLAMATIGRSLDVRVGYSDHTLGIEVALAAVALGACVIEKHFTLDREMPGPDHRASLEPEELRSMVRGIRKIECALGTAEKRPSPAELANRDVARRSLVASRPISTGEILSPSNVTAKRPGTGISPMLWDEVMGQRAPREFASDELIEL